MTDYMSLDNRVWIIGQTVDPHLYYYADANKTITIKLLDVNGVAVKDNNGNDITTSPSVSAGINEISIGDWLSAINKTWSSGVYVLLIDNGTQKMYTLLFITQGAISNPVSPDEEQYIEKIIVYDKSTNIMYELPPSTSQIPSDSRFMVFIYLHRERERQGKMIIIDNGITLLSTGWINQGIITMEITFNNMNDLVNWLVNHTTSTDKDVVKAIGDLANTDPSKIVNVVSLYGFNPVAVNTKLLYYDVIVDTSNNVYKIVYKYWVRLGFGWDEVVDFLAWVGGGAIAGAIAGSVLPGVGAAVGALAGAVAGGIGFALSKFIISDDTKSVQDLKDDVVETANKGKNNIIEKKQKALNDLDTLYQNGEITEHARDVLRQDIEELVNTALNVVDEVVDIAVNNIDKAYRKGYNDGVRESYKWIALAGVGGLFVGYSMKR